MLTILEVEARSFYRVSLSRAFSLSIFNDVSHSKHAIISLVACCTTRNYDSRSDEVRVPTRRDSEVAPKISDWNPGRVCERCETINLIDTHL